MYILEKIEFAKKGFIFLFVIIIIIIIIIRKILSLPFSGLGL